MNPMVLGFLILALTLVGLFFWWYFTPTGAASNNPFVNAFGSAPTS